MQIVYISNRPETSLETLEYVEALMPFVDEAVFVCPARMREEFRYPGRLRVAALDEESVLGPRLAELRSTSDHQVRNWLLRASLARAAEVRDELIMSDDDSRPLREISLDVFKQSGKYHSYYYYDLAHWRPCETDYDRGQHSTRRLLEEEGLATLSYSSHMPQIIDKRILGEVVDWLEARPERARRAVDEWSLYFNLAQRLHPELFHPPRVFRTLCWPALPTDWEYDVRPETFEFENFHPPLYREGAVFAGLPRRFDPRANRRWAREKIERRCRLQRIYDSRQALLRRKAAWLARRALLRCRAALGPGLRRSLARLVPAAWRRWADDVVRHGDDPAWSFPRSRPGSRRGRG